MLRRNMGHKCPFGRGRPELGCMTAGEYRKPRGFKASFLDSTGLSVGGSYRDRTDDIHGVNVALYQLS